MRRDARAEQVVGDRRRVVAEQQDAVEVVQLVVVGERPAVVAADERQEVLQVPVGDVGDVEADQAENDQLDAVARPVLADQQPGLRSELLRLEPRAPQRPRHDVEPKREQHQQWQPHPGRAQETVGVAYRIAHRAGADDGQHAHEHGVAHHECVGMPFHESGV